MAKPYLGPVFAPDFWLHIAGYVRDSTRGFDQETEESLYRKLEFTIKDVVREAMVQQIDGS